MKTDNFVTIIVPVYNAEPFLPECLDSILVQTHTALEILLIDDASTDNSGKICNAYAQKDTRIKVIHQPKNTGVSACRNLGIDNAKNPYIAFVDADDVIHNRYIETLLRNMTENDADISAVNQIHSKKKKFSERKKSIRIFSSEDAISNILFQKEIANTLWGKLFKSALFDEKTHFPENQIYEDLATLYLIFERSKKIVWTPQKLYFYRKRESSTIYTFSHRRLVVLDIVDDIVKYMRQNRPTLVAPAESRKLSANFNILWLCIHYKTNYTETQKRCWKNIKTLRGKFIFDRNIRLKNKIGILLSFGGLTFLTFLFKRIKILKSV